MKQNSKRKIILSESSKPEYPWTLQECYDSGEKIGKELVLCDSPVFFIADKLEYNQEIRFFDKKECEEKNGNTNEFITGAFHTDNNYSFIGTDKQIEQFNLIIHKISENSDYKEVCFIIGHSFETHESDVIYIHINLLENSFNNLVKLIQLKCLDVIQIIMSRASGFYSEDPFISSKEVKILRKESVEIIKKLNNNEMTPSVLGNVEEFSFHSKTIFRPVFTGDNTPAVSEEENKEDIPVATFVENFYKNHTLLKSIFTAIWLIILLLFLILIRK